MDFGETVPQGIEEQVNVHVTLPPESELIVAVNCCVDPGSTVTPEGEMLIAGGGGVVLPLELWPPHPKLAATNAAPSRVAGRGFRLL